MPYYYDIRQPIKQTFVKDNVPISYTTETKWCRGQLTKRERAFCETMQEGWLVRDRHNTLYFFQSKPNRGDEIWLVTGMKNGVMRIYPSMMPNFRFIRWEDEPYSIEELLTWEVIE